MSSTKSPDSVADTTTGRRHLLRIGGTALAVLVVDQLTKIWAVAELSDRDIDLFWTLRLNLVRNSGSAFGLGSGLGQWVGIAVIVVVGVLIRYASRVDHAGMHVLFGAVIGGAIGNLVDRVARADDGVLSGAVVDFIDLQWWPVFNIADMAVVMGALGLIVFSLGADE